MPIAALKSMAKKAGVSLEKAEKYWKDAREGASAQGKKENWPYVMSIVKKRLKLDSAGLAALEGHVAARLKTLSQRAG